jgi:hypothetical protein
MKDRAARAAVGPSLTLGPLTPLLGTRDKRKRGDRMTRKVFWQDPYLTDLDTNITSVKSNDITVEKTIF